MKRGLLRYRWGIITAAVYLLITVPCSVIYLLHPHEYSVPAFIMVYTSVLRRQMLYIGRLTHGQLIALAVVLTVTAVVYFTVAQALAWILKTIRSRRASPGSHLP